MMWPFRTKRHDDQKAKTLFEVFLACEPGIRSVFCDDPVQQAIEITRLRMTACITPGMADLYQSRKIPLVERPPKPLSEGVRPGRSYEGVTLKSMTKITATKVTARSIAELEQEIVKLRMAGRVLTDYIQSIADRAVVSELRETEIVDAVRLFRVE